MIVIGFVAAHFYDTLENGCVVTLENGCVVKKFPFIRSQVIKKAERDVQESRVSPDGSRNHYGNILRCKYDMYWVEYFVTGSNDGTLSDPKCSLKRILKVVIFPQVKQLFQSGGEFGNSQVVIQCGRAGSH